MRWQPKERPFLSVSGGPQISTHDCSSQQLGLPIAALSAREYRESRNSIFCRIISRRCLIWGPVYGSVMLSEGISTRLTGSECLIEGHSGELTMAFDCTTESQCRTAIKDM